MIKHIIVSAHERIDFDMDDLLDHKTKKLKPVKEVIDDNLMSSRDFPRIIDCGPDEAQNWYEPDPEDCSCYFVCTGKYYVHRQCSAGLIFDDKSHECNWPNVVDCGERPVPWTIPEYVGPHFNAHQYNLYEYMNSQKIQRKNNQHDNHRSHWLLEDYNTGNDTEYEYFM